ncbi:hypothetical protein RRG08_012609 [Elysia crispata]|uniref:Uncharacterized protein n=1 Tax=Elysia crispata TaxID=231223 RepID=A0AAE1DU91_9GAST|nr:hypothetical protein RRG08_012609 [Elysia crispata]
MLVYRTSSTQLEEASDAGILDSFQTVRGSKRCWYTGLVPDSQRQQAMLVYRTSSTQSEEASDAGIPD